MNLQTCKPSNPVPWTHCIKCDQPITGYEPRLCIDCMSDTDKLAADGCIGYSRYFEDITFE